MVRKWRGHPMVDQDWRAWIWHKRNYCYHCQSKPIDHRHTLVKYSIRLVCQCILWRGWFLLVDWSSYFWNGQPYPKSALFALWWSYYRIANQLAIAWFRQLYFRLGDRWKLWVIYPNYRIWWRSSTQLCFHGIEYRCAVLLQGLDW